MQSLETTAFLLRRVDFGERDVMLHLLSPDLGRISAVARGAQASRRRFAGRLEPLRMLDASLTPRRSGDLFTIEALEVRLDYPGLADRIEPLLAAGYITELSRDLLRDGEEAHEAFDLLHQTYELLSDAHDASSIHLILARFELLLLSTSGFPLTLDHCARCASPIDPPPRLSRRGEGLICPDCRRPGESLGIVDDATLHLLRFLQTHDSQGADFSPDTLAQTRRVLANALAQVLDTPPSSRALLDQLL